MSPTIEIDQDIERAVDKRRNFAIISHPDAGKTTLTEKLLLSGGAIHQAGAVKADHQSLTGKLFIGKCIHRFQHVLH